MRNLIFTIPAGGRIFPLHAVRNEAAYTESKELQ